MKLCSPPCVRQALRQGARWGWEGGLQAGEDFLGRGDDFGQGRDRRADMAVGEDGADDRLPGVAQEQEGARGHRPNLEEVPDVGDLGQGADAAHHRDDGIACVGQGGHALHQISRATFFMHPGVGGMAFEHVAGDADDMTAGLSRAATGRFHGAIVAAGGHGVTGPRQKFAQQACFFVTSRAGHAA